MRWLGRHRDQSQRIARLEADRERMSRQLDGLRECLRVAGADTGSADVPPALLAAAATAGPGGESVLLTTPEGREVIAVVSGDGDPAQCWDAIRRIAALS
jgi:hypothetical protein